ncbi:GSCOCG00009953001-RA-CDS [Cotesia congregata]|nr:GSCOCG00009953001-RA-CDS [Cotesia congregata]
MTVESCAMATVKYLLFFFNVIFSAAGLGILIVGCKILADVTNYNHFMGGRILAPAIVLIIIGMIVFVIAFLGCFGAVKEIHILLIAFGVALLTIFAIELAIGIGIAIFQSDVSDLLRTTLRESLVTYESEPDNKVAWDSIQTYFHCCGVDSSDDWEESLKEKLPSTCCYSNNTDPCEKGNPLINPHGCYQTLLRQIRTNSELLIWLGAAIALIEVSFFINIYIVVLWIKFFFILDR